jgi:hypothetical protein
MSDHKYELQASINDNGEIEIVDYNRFKRLFARVFHGKDLVLTIERLKRSRSDRQNRYYWGVVIPHIRHFHKHNNGEKISPEEVHVFNTQEIMGAKPQIKNVLGCDVLTVGFKRSSEMTTAEFTDFIEKIRAYWLEFGLDIPEPSGENLLTDLD